ncbi:hypothetical protein B9Z19DRAFT_1067298 [Tuber borchii]|uniref:Uncharacterized protein n=1 Tax=Tuber borchii TaxID=42251 RepID=A0A2T6ZJD0_TUBBO|nr:hypothetical protein B9Z19DRAFT_1067298 [Tuber borchii]
MVKLDLHSQMQLAASLTPQNYANPPFNAKTPIVSTITNTPENTAILSHTPSTILPQTPGAPALFPGPETSVSANDYIPIIHITCTTQYRVLYRNFKVTWGPAYQDMETCARLRRFLKNRVGWAVTGYSCRTAAAPVVGGYVMEATGQMPLGCGDLLSTSIRETFAVNPQFLRFLRAQLRYFPRIMLYTTP